MKEGEAVAIDFTALTEREICAEEQATDAGYFAVARTLRRLFNRADTPELERIVGGNARTAARCASMPVRKVLPVWQPVELDPGDGLRMSEAGGRWT